MGKRPELTGGGLTRSVGGWQEVKSLRRQSIHLKSDERILGQSDFVESVLQQQNERLDRKYRLKAMGYDLGKIV